MNRGSLLIILLLSATLLPAQNQTEEIKSVLGKQVAAWNAGDLEGFMEGYWKADKLMFVGKSGVTYGWEATYQRYLKSYPDKAAMGLLKFDFVTIEPLGEEHWMVIGKWQLEREKDNIGGHFSLIFRRIDGAWRIVVDHTS